MSPHFKTKKKKKKKKKNLDNLGFDNQLNNYKYKKFVQL